MIRHPLLDAIRTERARQALRQRLVTTFLIVAVAVVIVLGARCAASIRSEEEARAVERTELCADLCDARGGIFFLHPVRPRGDALCTCRDLTQVCIP